MPNTMFGSPDELLGFVITPLPLTPPAVSTTALP